MDETNLALISLELMKLSALPNSQVSQPDHFLARNHRYLVPRYPTLVLEKPAVPATATIYQELHCLKKKSED